MLASSRTIITIIRVSLIIHQQSLNSSLHTWVCFFYQVAHRPVRFSYGHSPLGANVRVGRTSFIHGDGRHFASSRAISESIKKAINFERAKREKKKKIVGAINQRGRLPDADKSLTYWQHLSAPCPQSPSRRQQNPFPHMAAPQTTAGDTGDPAPSHGVQKTLINGF